MSLKGLAMTFERGKGAEFLYGISNLLERPGISLEEIIKGLSASFPAALQYPEVTCGGSRWMTGVKTKTQGDNRKLASDIIVNDETGNAGSLLQRNRPQSHEGLSQ